MRSPALRRSNGVVSHRPQQRMAEFHPVAGETDQPGRLGLAEGVAVTAAQPRRRGGHLHGRAPSGSGGDQERDPGRRAHLIQAGGEPLPDRRARLQRPPGYVRAVELFRRQSRCQLHQCERIAAGLGVQPPGHRRCRPDPGNGLHQPRRCLLPEAAQIAAQQAGQCRPARAQRHYAPDRVAVQAADREQQRLTARRIQPVCIIDQDQQRTVFCDHGQQCVSSCRHH